MPVIDDPQSWLDAPRNPEGMTRSWLHEALRPGDVLDDGSILREGTATQTSGPVLVSIGQAYAASYYGWVSSGLRLLQNGTIFTQICRYYP